MATIQVFYDFTSRPKRIIAAWYEHSNPTAEAGSVELVDKEDVLVIEGVNPVVYSIKFFESTNGVVRDALIGSCFVDASQSAGSTVEWYEYKVGGTGTYDPAAWQSVLSDPRLKGEDYKIFKEGYGIPLPEDEYIVNTDGGFTLSSDQFADGARWAVQLIRKTAAPTTTTTSTSDFNTVKVVVSSELLNDSYYRKNNVAGFSSLIGSTTFPSFSTIPNGTKLRFSTHSGAQRYWKLQFATGETISIEGEGRNVIWLAKGEVLELLFIDGAGYVTNDYEGYKRLGDLIPGRIIKPGTIAAIGTEYNYDDLGRFYTDFIAKLDPTQIVDFATWGQSQTVNIAGVNYTKYPYKGKFAIDDINRKCKVPDHRNMSVKYLQNFDGTPDAAWLSNGIGGLQTEQLLQHGHRVNTTGNQSGVNPGRALQRASTDGDGYPDLSNGKGEGSKGPYIEIVGGDSNRVDAHGFIPLYVI